MKRVKRYWYKSIWKVFFFMMGLLFTFCGKDPVFDYGDYLYEYDDFSKVDDINGILIHWTDTMDISDEQKTVVRNLVANMVSVSGGTFRMGAQNSDPQSDNYDTEARDNEGPVHEVTLSNYYIGKFEITQREWRTIMGDELDWPEQYGRGDDFPAYNVSRTDALRFVERLSAMTRLPFQLPTEAQWEFAARGGSNSLHYRFSGSNDVDEVAWHKENANGSLHPVGGKRPNELGLHDMSGNLWEWCLDTYGPYPSTLQTNPVANSGSQFVLRGGSWTYFPTYCRVTCRDSFSGNDASVSVGFRVAMEHHP
jgi:formylglycine-generating enzyme required for sulfatase activity